MSVGFDAHVTPQASDARVQYSRCVVFMSHLIGVAIAVAFGRPLNEDVKRGLSSPSPSSLPQSPDAKQRTTPTDLVAGLEESERPNVTFTLLTFQGHGSLLFAFTNENKS